MAQFDGRCRTADEIFAAVMAEPAADAAESVAVLRRSGVGRILAAAGSGPDRVVGFAEVVCDLAALDGSLGWLAAVFGPVHGLSEHADRLIAPALQGSGTVREDRLTGRWDSVVGAGHADGFLLPVDGGREVLVPRSAVHVEPVDARTGLVGAAVCDVIAAGVAVGAPESVPGIGDPGVAGALAAGAAAAVVGCADGLWRKHVEQVRARLTISYGGDEVTDDATAEVARSAADIDAARMQILTPDPDGPPTPGWAYRQAVARARGAADRLLATSRHALDAADPVSRRWCDLQAGCRLAEAVFRRTAGSGERLGRTH